MQTYSLVDDVFVAKEIIYCIFLFLGYEKIGGFKSSSKKSDRVHQNDQKWLM